MSLIVTADRAVGLLPDTRPTGGVAIMAAARILLSTIERGTPLDARTLRTAMKDAFGASDADGAWVWKDAYEAAECAMVLFIRKYGPAMRAQARDDAEFLALVERLSALMPSQTRRSDESEAMQQFSTLIGLSLVAAIAADAQPGELVLEPSAGNGLMAVWPRISGATLALNELSDTRADCLGSLFGVPVTRHDAATIDDRLDRAFDPRRRADEPALLGRCEHRGPLARCHARAHPLRPRAPAPRRSPRHDHRIGLLALRARPGAKRGSRCRRSRR